MPSQHALIWSEEDQHYELHTQGHLISCFRREDDPSFSRWLAHHSAFAFVGQSGRLAVLKEARSRGTSYWYAYRTRAQHSRKRYLGGSDHITFAHLEQEAKALVSLSSLPSCAERPLSPETTAPSSLREEGEPDALWTQVMQQEKPWGEVLSTKLSPPRLPVSLVERSHLLTVLQAVPRHPLRLVAATAGSGKTTLLSAWVAHQCTCRKTRGWGSEPTQLLPGSP